MSVLYRNANAMLDQLQCPFYAEIQKLCWINWNVHCPCYAEIQKIWWINWIVRAVQKYKSCGRSIALSNVHAMQKYNSCGGSIGMSMLCRNTKDMVDQLHCPCYAEIQKLWWINWIVHGMQKYKRYSGSIGLSVRALVAFVCLKVIS